MAFRSSRIARQHFNQILPWQERVSALRIIQNDIVDANRANLLQLTLNPLSKRAHLPELSTGDILPPSWHYTLFPSLCTESELASDGYDAIFAPPSPFNQRMWGAGSLHFHTQNPLLIGQKVSETMFIDRIETRMTGNRGPAVYVWLKKEIQNDMGPAITESRCLIYMNPEFNQNGKTEPQGKSDRHDSTKNINTKDYQFKESVTPTPMMLFRYSALTFNTHLIHYNQRYTQDSEGYAGMQCF